MINKNTNINQEKNSLRGLFCLLFLFLLISCEDNGCIDSDDFGEYEIYTFPIASNRLEEFCKYDPKLDDNSQALGIKTCAIACTTNNAVTNKNQCKQECQDKCFIDKDSLQKIFNGAASLTKSSEPPWFAVGGGGETNISIEQNSQILITAQGVVNLGNTTNKSDIGIVNSDVGDVNLSTIKNHINIVKLSGGENIEINFSGSWSDSDASPSKTYFNENINTSLQKTLLKNDINYYKSSFANGARRIFAYFIPFPDGYQKYQSYNFPLAPNPKAWICNNSLDANPGDPKRHLSCSNNNCETADCFDDYASQLTAPYNFVPASSTDASELEKRDDYNKTFSKVFDVDNESADNTRYQGGTGFIRYKNDNLYGSDKQLLAVPNVFKKTIDSSSLRDFNFTLEFPSKNKSYLVVFRNHSVVSPRSGLNCNIKFNLQTIGSSLQRLKTADSNGTLLDYDSANNIFPALTPNSSLKFIFEPSDLANDYVIQASTPTAFDNESCNLVAYFYPFYEIEFSKSGYIDFGIVENAIYSSPATAITQTNNCTLKFRILNQNNNYEEDNFKVHTIFSALSPVLTTNPKKYFVRKGQKLSFSPESWEGEWSTKYSGITKECGVGFYVNLTPRPAVFCSSVEQKEFITINQDIDDTNNCVPYYDPITKKETGCQEDASSCLSLENSLGTGANPNFCPSECIEKDFSTCRSAEVPPTISGSANPAYANNLYTTVAIANCLPSSADKICYDGTTGIVPSACATDPTKCATYASFNNIEPYKKIIADALARTPRLTLTTSTASAGCVSCKAKMKADAVKSLYLQGASLGGTTLQQCYDVEEYKGKSEDLKTLIAKAVENPKEAKLVYETEGIKKLKGFDGDYGNFYPLDYVKTLSGTNFFKIENTSFINKAGYIKFIILDPFLIPNTSNNFFEETIATPPNRGLSTTNLRISAKSSNELSNGAGLNIALCKESSATGNECSKLVNAGQTIPITINEIKEKFSVVTNSTLPIIEYDADNSVSTISNYKFNDFGQLIRTTNPPVAGPGVIYGRECNDPDELAPAIGKNFLCFKDVNNFVTRQNYDPSDGNKYRLAFKIIDNETPNCSSSYQECIPASPPVAGETCLKFAVLNPTWNGTDDGYCGASGSCTKKYQCIDDKYLNNSGSYNVAVKIKRDSKIKVSNFINSIISPVLDEVDGFSKNKNNFIGVESVYNYIESRSFNTASVSGGFMSDTQDAIDMTNLKTLDSKIVGILYKEAKNNETIELNPNSIDAVCRGNCFISYVAFAIYGYQSTSLQVSAQSGCKKSYRSASKFSIKNKCTGKTSCSFVVNESEFQPDVGDYPTTTVLSTATPPANCEINNKKLMIQYIYNNSDQPLYKENQARRIYTSITNNLIFKSFLSLSVVMMLSFYGMGFLMGVSELKQSEIIDRLIKIAIIYLFTDPQFGWVWFEKFFVTFFKNGTDFLTFTMAAIFDETGRIDAIINSGDFSDKSAIFYDVDRVIGLFLVNDVIHKKIASLLFYNFFGIMYVFVIYYSAIAYVYAISNAVLIYLTSQFFTSVLFVVGPFFFVFILFKQTKGFFDNWINSLIGFSLQQIFLVFTLSLFNTILYFVIKSTLGFKVCWDTVWKINSSLSSISILSFWTPQESPYYIRETSEPSVEGTTTGIPTLPMLLSLWTVCVMMKAFITSITDLAATLSGGMSATEIGSGIAGAMNEGIGEMQKKGNELYKESGAKKMMEKADKKLFDSGRLAKLERSKLNNRDKENQNLKNQMRKSGDKAVSDYKVNNHEEFSKMSEAEKRKTLTDVKMNAMKGTAKAMGKSDKQIKELMSDKNGREYRGDNIFGFMKSAGMNEYKNGGKSLNQQALQVDTRMSEKEMKKALKATDDPDKRKEFINNVKEGKIRKKESFKEGAKDFINNIREGNVGKAFAGVAERSLNDGTSNFRQERREAVKQLEDSGAIKKQSYNTGADGGGGAKGVAYRMAENVRYGLSRRSKEDEEKITNKIQENRLANATEKGPNVDAKGINKLEAFNKKLDEKEGYIANKTEVITPPPADSVGPRGGDYKGPNGE